MLTPIVTRATGGRLQLSFTPPRARRSAGSSDTLFAPPVSIPDLIQAHHDTLRASRIVGLSIAAIVAWLSLAVPIPLVVAVPLVLAGMASAMAVVFEGVPLKAKSEEMRAGVTRRTTVLAASGIAIAVLPVLVGGGLTGETPHVRDGVRVATVHGEVVRHISEAEYDRLKNAQIRVLCSGGGLGLRGESDTRRSGHERQTPPRGGAPRRGRCECVSGAIADEQAKHLVRAGHVWAPR